MGTEAEKTGTAEQQTETGTPPEATKEKDDTVSIRKGELQGYKTQLRELKKQLEDFSAQKTAEEQAKLKAAADWETLERKTKAELETVKAELEKTRRSALIEKARSALLGAGMRATLAVDGALSTLPMEMDGDAVSAWVDEIKAAHPGEFTAPPNPIGVPSAGAAARPTGDEAANLKAEWTAALKKTPAAAQAVKKKIDAYMASHGGKNPVA